MKSIINYIFIIGVAIVAISCATPEDPTPENQVIGSWVVNQFFVNGELEGSGSTALSRFTLERDKSFILVDNNSLAIVGTWSNSGKNLQLRDESGTVVYDFAIVFQTFEKMQLLQTIANPSAGDITIRYLMNATDNDTY